MIKVLWNISTLVPPRVDIHLPHWSLLSSPHKTATSQHCSNRLPHFEWSCNWIIFQSMLECSKVTSEEFILSIKRIVRVSTGYSSFWLAGNQINQYFPPGVVVQQIVVSSAQHCNWLMLLSCVIKICTSETYHLSKSWTSSTYSSWPNTIGKSLLFKHTPFTVCIAYVIV